MKTVTVIKRNQVSIVISFAVIALFAGNIDAEHPIFAAITVHNGEQLEALVRSDENNCKGLLSDKGHPPLYAAVMSQFVAGVEILLNAGHDANEQSGMPDADPIAPRTGMTPLCSLAKRLVFDSESMKIADLLIAHGGIPAKKWKGLSCLQIAINHADLRPSMSNSHDLSEYIKVMLSHAFTHRGTDEKIIAKLFPLYSNGVEFSQFLSMTNPYLPGPLSSHLVAMANDLDVWFFPRNEIPSRVEMNQIIGNLRGVIDDRLIFRLVLSYRLKSHHDGSLRSLSRDSFSSRDSLGSLSDGSPPSSSSSTISSSPRTDSPKPLRSKINLRLRFLESTPKSWDSWPAEDIACAIYAMDRELFLNVSDVDFFQKALTKKGHPKSLMTLVEFGEKLRTFIPLSILKAHLESKSKGEKSFRMWVFVAQDLHKQGDLFGLAHVLAGLEDRGLSRLKLSESKSLKKEMALVEQFSALLDSRRNYPAYREFIRSAQTYLPMTSVEQADLEHLQESSPHYAATWVGKVLNMEKLRGMHGFVKSYRRCQKGLRKVEPNPEPTILEALATLPTTHQCASEHLSYTISEPTAFTFEESDRPWDEWEADQLHAWFSHNGLKAERQQSLIDGVVDGNDLLEDALVWFNSRAQSSSSSSSSSQSPSASWRMLVYEVKGLNFYQLAEKRDPITITEIMNHLDDQVIWLLWLIQNGYDMDIDNIRRILGTTAQKFYENFLPHIAQKPRLYLEKTVGMQKLGLRIKLIHFHQSIERELTAGD